jgi:hypothetical protein
MSFIITRQLAQLPSYAALRQLAEQNGVNVIGNEHAGSLQGQGGNGDYEFGADYVRGDFSAYGVVGTFECVPGKATVTVTDKPFWLPEALLKQKLAEGLERFCIKQV